MNIIKKITLATSLIVSLTVITSSFAESPTKNDDAPVTFKKVMQGLLADTKMITEGIILEDFTLVERSAARIAKHPKPAMSQRKKLMKSLGGEIAKFKGYDGVVHNGAVKIVEAAKNKDMATVTAEYEKLVSGCQSCHSVFKERVAKALK
jgi:cytochrome c556